MHSVIMLATAVYVLLELVGISGEELNTLTQTEGKRY